MPPHVQLEPASDAHRRAFLAAVARSRDAHHPWVAPPRTLRDFAAYLAKHKGTTQLGFFALSDAGELVGVVNVTEIVRGAFRSGYLGYYGFVPFLGQGYMTNALSQVVTRAFHAHGLHRLEANVQPGNAPSLALVRRLGFRKEGFSERYLRIDGQWRDHERWAITSEEWHGEAV